MEGNEFNAGLQQRSPRGELAMEAERRHGGMRSRPLARSGGVWWWGRTVWWRRLQRRRCENLFFFFWLLWVLSRDVGGFWCAFLWVLISGCWGFSFELGWLGGFWLTYSREGRWLMGFTMTFSSCLGILVGAAALVAASAATALAAAQISWGRYMKVILVMVWVEVLFFFFCVWLDLRFAGNFFFSDRALLWYQFDVGQTR